MSRARSAALTDSRRRSTPTPARRLRSASAELVGHLAQVLPEVRVGDIDQQVGALAHRATGQLRGAVLRDHDSGVVARRGDHRSLGSEARYAGHALSLAFGRRAEADERVGVDMQLRPGHEVLVPADTRDLATV